MEKCKEDGGASRIIEERRCKLEELENNCDFTPVPILCKERWEKIHQERKKKYEKSEERDDKEQIGER